jgi:Coenzyme PQQ synthesis protein D (PqqD)
MQGRKLRIQQSRKVKVRNVDGEIFLIDDEGFSIYHTNQIGLAIWRMAARPANPNDIVRTLQQAFPEKEKAEIRKDYYQLQGQMIGAGLLKRAK